MTFRRVFFQSGRSNHKMSTKIVNLVQFGIRIGIEEDFKCCFCNYDFRKISIFHKGPLLLFLGMKTFQSPLGFWH